MPGKGDVADTLQSVSGQTDEFMDKVREIFPNAYPGKDGKSLELNFEE